MGGGRGQGEREERGAAGRDGRQWVGGGQGAGRGTLFQAAFFRAEVRPSGLISPAARRARLVKAGPTNS